MRRLLVPTLLLTAAPPGGGGSTVGGDLVTLPDDAAAMAAGGADVARDGAVLRVGKRRFRDRGTCDGFATCQRWRLDRALPDGWYGVSVSYGEAHGYYLVNARGGVETEIGARPVLSPDGTRFAVANQDDGDAGSLQGVAVWQLTPRFTRPLFRHDLDAEYAIPSVEAWRGPDCVEFRWESGREGSPPGRRFAFRQGAGWRFAEQPGPPCAFAST